MSSSQNKALADMKSLLRDSATREKEFLNEREELERKISILERFPPGSQLTDSEVCSTHCGLVLWYCTVVLYCGTFVCTVLWYCTVPHTVVLYCCVYFGTALYCYMYCGIVLWCCTVVLLCVLCCGTVLFHTLWYGTVVFTVVLHCTVICTVWRIYVKLIGN